MPHRAWDHPRVCGEQFIVSPSILLLLGSPPRVRGTAVPTFSDYGEEDHPRVCGEQLYYKLNRHKRGGSPPRVRGTERHPTDGGGAERITPACAGNSWISSFWMGFFEDHPRVCGEQFPLIY